MYPEGIYMVKATDWGLTVTSTGKEQFHMGFDVIGRVGPDQSVTSCEPGHGRWSITTASPTRGAW